MGIKRDSFYLLTFGKHFKSYSGEFLPIIAYQLFIIFIKENQVM